jgi:hypothetical protein
MNYAQDTSLAIESWPTCTDAHQGESITVEEEIAVAAQALCCFTATNPHDRFERLLESDGLCGDLERPFSYSAEDVYCWALTFFGSNERLEGFLSVAWDMEMGDCLMTLGAIWTGLDYVGLYSLELQSLLDFKDVVYDSPIIEMMTSEEMRAFDALPDEITIYRGCGPRNEFGYSWTLDRTMAETFPFKRGYRTEYPTLLTMKIKKTRAAALKLDRQEQEIVLFDDGQSFCNDWTKEPILTDPAGTPVQSWAYDPEGVLIEVWLEDQEDS